MTNARVEPDRAIEFFITRNQGAFLPGAYLLRARARRNGGDSEGALADYAAALAAVEKQRPSLDVAGEIIDETIELRLGRGEVEEAFRVANRAEPRVPRGSALLAYAVLPKAIAIFCVTDAGITAANVPIERRALADDVLAFSQGIRSRAPERDVRAAGALLFERLIAPVRERVANATELVIVPDLELYAVPFAALFDARRGMYLIEDFTLRFATSASAFETPSTAALQPALVVADPATPRWPRLPQSRDEAMRIASLHGATLLAGDDATPAKFLDAARDSALIHFAGHADSDARTSFGALLLAGENGVVGTSDITRLSLRQHPLVVLAACGTFRGDVRHVAGMPSLARAFLTAGARAVAGTLWEIDDDVSAALFLRVHQHLHAGDPPATALRAAQLELLRSSDPRWKHPASWSAEAILSNESGVLK